MKKQKLSLFNHLLKKELKSETLTIRITPSAKEQIRMLAEEYNLSQSELIEALVNEAMERNW